MALIGLQGMTCDSPEVKGLLNALEPKLSECNEQFGAQELGRCLVGIHAMSSTEPEAAAIIQQIQLKISLSEFRGQPNLQFLLYGKYVRVKIGNSVGLM